ncbi:MAG: site-specific integrase, partial [Nitrospira sp.]|nr:site-specific integrase [Nitrospira sp.]
MARIHGKDRGIQEKPKGSGKWWVRLFVNGRERRYRCDSKSQAKALYGKLKAEQREGIYFPEKYAQTKEITLRTWIDRYLEGSTNRSFQSEQHYGRFWKLLLGKRVLSQITTDDCRRIQAKLNDRRKKVKLQEKETRKTGRLSPATINRRFAFLRHVFMIAVKDDLLSRNPVSALKFFPEAKRTRYYSDLELTRIQSHMEEAHWQLVAFAVETGLRRADQFSLKWSQINMETSTLVIPLPKGGRTLIIPLSEGAKTILRSLDSFLTSPYVFPSPNNPLNPRSPICFIAKVFKPALRKAGILDGRWHDLRHTAASRRVMAGVDLYAVKEILGHRDIGTTARYAHLSPGFLQEAINRGSLVGTGTKTGTSSEGKELTELGEELKVVEKKGNLKWLGDQESNL